MRGVVVAYEDHYHHELHLLIKRLRRDQGATNVVLEARTVDGTGGFVQEVPRLLRTPLKQTRRPPDLLVCVADADRPGNLVPGVPDAPSAGDGEALDAWIATFEKTWLEHLVGRGPVGAPDRDRLRVLCLRWNKESVLIASPDALLEHAERRGRREEIQSLLDGCRPSPGTLADEDHHVRYRSPLQCMDRIFGVLEDRRYKKGRDDEDLLRDSISGDPGHRERVLKRCPDLRRLLVALA